MAIYDRTEMVGRTNIEQINKLFSMGSTLESSVDANTTEIASIPVITITDNETFYSINW